MNQRPQVVVLAHMNLKLDGVTARWTVTPAVKVQEWNLQTLTKLDKERTSSLRRATMRASYVTSNR